MTLPESQKAAPPDYGCPLDVGVLAALDACSRDRVVGDREAPARLGTRHASSGAVAAAHEAVGVAEPTNNVTGCFRPIISLHWKFSAYASGQP
jgi:hypothetical protein